MSALLDLLRRREPTGRHRAGARRPAPAPALVPVTPIPAAPHGLLDEAEIARLIADGDIEPNDYAYCPRCKCITMQRLTLTGTHECWNCTPREHQ